MRDEVALAEELVAIPSPSGEEGRLAARLADLLPDDGYAVQVDGVGNVIAARGRGRPIVMFLGHLDTVPGLLPVHRTATHLAGRGSVDAKGALAAALAAGASLGELPGTLAVVGAVGEEADSRGARHLLRGPAPDYLIVGEPGGWDAVTIAYKGMARLVFRASVEASHGSAPAPSAGDLVVAYALALRRLVEAHRGPSPFRSPSLRVEALAGGPRGLLDEAAATFDLRLPPGLDPATLLGEARALASGGRLEVAEAVPAVEVDPANPVVRALKGAIRSLGGTPRLLRKAGTSDMNLAAAAWPIPMATYGPGDPHLDHSPHEALELEDLRRARRVLEAAFGWLLSLPWGTSAPGAPPIPS